MTPIAAAIIANSKAATMLLAQRAQRPHSALLRLLFSFGLLGLFFVALVDSSFVPLPLPGITDVMLVVLAARHSNLILLLAASTAGSAIGGYLSYRAGYSGGMAFLEKRVPPSIFKLVRDWMERHAILAVALPAIIPPPMPLTPFVLAAGALRMSRQKFLTTFTISRGLRHALAIWLGVHYGRHILRLWNNLSAEYATPVTIILWTTILSTAAFAFWKLYKTSRSIKAPPKVASQTSSTV